MIATVMSLPTTSFPQIVLGGIKFFGGKKSRLFMA